MTSSSNEPVSRRFRAVTGSWLIHAAMPIILFGQPADVGFPPPDVIQSGLHTLARLAKPETYRSLGFDSVAQAASATVGEPFHVYYVRLTELQAYQRSTNPQTLLHDAKSVVFPVLAEGKLRSSITCDRRGPRWVASRFGEPSRILLLVEARAALNAFLHDQAVERNSFIVEIPAMRTAFVAFRSGQVLQMVQLGLRGMSTKPGEGKTANEIFAELAAQAKRVPLDKPT